LVETAIAGFVRFITTILTGVPSIIAGVFAYGVIVLTEFSAVAGGFALAILMLPIVAYYRQSLETHSHSSTPCLRSLRQPLSNDLSHRRCRRNTCHRHFTRCSCAAGETAPLLFTALFSQIGRRILVLLLPIRINFLVRHFSLS